MKLDTKNLNEEQLAEIQKHIDELAATNKHQLPLHLRMPGYGESYMSLHADGERGNCDRLLDDVNTDRLDRGLVSLDPEYLDFNDAQRLAYTKILRFIAENGLEIVDKPSDEGYPVFINAREEVDHARNVNATYNAIPKLKFAKHAQRLIENCSDDIRKVLSWYVPEEK